MTAYGCYLPVHAEEAPDVREVAAVARDAEQAGLRHVWAADHLTWNRQMLAPLPTLAHVAGGTERIGLGIGVYLLPLRHPALAAKDLATLDHLSGGRLELGVGVGGENPDEYRAAGIPPGRAGRRLDDALDVVTALWEGRPTPPTETFGELPESPIGPRPARPVPLWVGGRSEAAITRAARWGHGWLAMWVSPERVAQEAQHRLHGLRIGLNVFTRVERSRAAADQVLERQVASAYRMPYDKVRRYALAGTPTEVAERIAAYVAAGVTDVVFNFAGADEREQLRRICDDVLPEVGGSVA
ncbi:LLM class flavin-dependent oxidoreductase [Nocardioides humi]|uniref:Luciferase-like domain-containing protein n=1 Tax=Nocardioides humi TaxID=449461 RepID=A0ABN2BRU4_9ACTN|nr:LLM class flavin-dependent oxidoreductase [Nocardioides humi]